jgi:phage-related protein
VSPAWKWALGSAFVIAEPPRRGRVLFGFHDGMLIALTAFIKKTQATPAGEITLAQHRLKEAIAP